MSNHSAQILELLCHCLIFSFLVNSFLCPYTCQLRVFWLWSLTFIWAKLHHSWYSFTYVYDALKIILIIGIISVYLWNICGSHPWAHTDGSRLTLSLFRSPDIIQVYLFSNRKVLELLNKVTWLSILINNLGFTIFSQSKGRHRIYNKTCRTEENEYTTAWMDNVILCVRFLFLFSRITVR